MCMAPYWPRGSSALNPPEAGLCRALLLRSRLEGGKQFISLSVYLRRSWSLRPCGWCLCVLCTETLSSPDVWASAVLCRQPPSHSSHVPPCVLGSQRS